MARVILMSVQKQTTQTEEDEMEKKSYQVEQTKSGHVFGVYQSECAEGALYLFCADARISIDDIDSGIKAYQVED